MEKKKLTAEDVWAMFAESDRQRKENERSRAVLEEAKKYGMGVIKQVGKGLEIKADNLRAY
jgi:hypothetical protein